MWIVPHVDNLSRQSLSHPVGYLALYLLYVITVVVSAYIYNRQSHSLHGPLPNSTEFNQGEKNLFLLINISAN